MPAAVQSPQIEEPDPTIVTGNNMFPAEVHKQLQAAMDATAQGKTVPVDAPKPSEPAAPAAKATPDPKLKVPAQPSPAAKPEPKKDEPTYPRSAIQWEEWKKAERERMEKEYSDKFKTAPAAVNGDYEKIKSERDQLAKHIQLVAIERDPSFNKEFETASSAVLTAAKAAAGKNASEVEKVLKMAPSEARDEAIEKLMEDVPPYKQTQIGYALAEMDKLRNLKDARIKESVENWEKLQSQNIQQRTQQQQAERGEMVKVLDRTIAEWSDKEKGLPVLQKRDGDTAWNSSIDDSIQLAKDIFGGELDIDSLARASLWAASAPLLLKEVASLQEQGKAKDAEIAQLKGLSPGADGQGGGGEGGEGDGIPDGTPYGTAIGMAIRKAGINMPSV